MGQGARWDRGDLFEGISLEYLHDIQCHCIAVSALGGSEVQQTIRSCDVSVNR
jgi:hypothetical protein